MGDLHRLSSVRCLCWVLYDVYPGCPQASPMLLGVVISRLDVEGQRYLLRRHGICLYLLFEIVPCLESESRFGISNTSVIYADSKS